MTLAQDISSAMFAWILVFNVNKKEVDISLNVLNPASNDKYKKSNLSIFSTFILKLLELI